MEGMSFLVDIDRCVGCHACEVACKQEHGLPSGPRWTSVVTSGPRKIEGELHLDFVFATCLHCNDPACRAVCAAGAISKQNDGLVMINEGKCKKCGLCVVACPFGAVHLRPDNKNAWKCDQCADRVGTGLPPACVQHCAGGALQHVTPEELLTITSGRHAAQFGKVCYVSAKWRLSEGTWISA